MTGDEMLGRFKRMTLELFPELRGTHLPLKGRVTAVHGEAGKVNVSSNGSRRYSVDIKPLHPDGAEDKSRPTLKDVPLDVPWSGDKRGVFALPKVASIVRVGFYGGSSAHPYIDGILPDGSVVPAVEQGQYLIQLNDQMTFLLDDEGVKIRVKDPNAKVVVEAAGDVSVKSDMNVSVEAALEATVKAGTSATVEAAIDATVKAGVNAKVQAGVKAAVEAPLVDLGAAPALGIAYELGLVTTVVGPAVIQLGSKTCKVTP